MEGGWEGEEEWRGNHNRNEVHILFRVYTEQYLFSTVSETVIHENQSNSHRCGS